MTDLELYLESLKLAVRLWSGNPRLKNSTDAGLVVGHTADDIFTALKSKRDSEKETDQ